MEPSIMRKVEYRAYFDRKAHDLRTLHPAFLSALRLHWSGEFEASVEFYGSNIHKIKEESPNQFELALADYVLLQVKIGRAFPPELTIDRFKDPNAKLVLHYARFYWAFWTDHSIANNSLWKMLWLSFRSECSRFSLTAVYLLAHLATISGKLRSGIWVSNFIYKYFLFKMKSGNSWPQMTINVVLASYPYNRFVAGRMDGEQLDKSIYFAERHLPETDHFYQSLLLISGLYGFAYSGNIARTEVYSARFQRLHEQGQLKRYQPLSKIMVLLPFALRGYGHLVRTRFFKQVEQFNPTNSSALINSQFYRVCAIISLLLGNNEDALKYIQLGTLELRKTNSFRYWFKFDRRVSELASRQTPFDPRQDRLLNLNTKFRTPPQLGPMLLDFISILPDSFQHGKPWLVEQIKVQLCEHLNWSNVRMIHKSESTSTGNPAIVIDDFLLEFLDVPQSNFHYLEEILSSISPALHTCMRAYEDLAKAQDMKEAAMMGELASQVAHNILSPIDVLETLVPVVKTPDEGQKVMVRNLVSRIKSVANGLLQKRNALKKFTHEVSNISDHLIAATIDNVSTEKRVQFAKFGTVDIRWNTGEHTYGIFSRFNEIEMETVLSNIVNNSVEAIRSKNDDQGGYVEISLGHDNESAIISISDNGPGIPKEVIGRLTEKDFSFGKVHGNGLGLYHARQCIESWGGTLGFISEDDRTTVEIRLPKQSPPAWFMESISLTPKNRIAILDDDESVHQVWRNRLAPFGLDLHHFYSIGDFISWQKSHSGEESKTLYFIDYELGDADARINQDLKNGLDVISFLKIQNRAVLVSSHFRDKDIIEESCLVKVQVLPKNLAAHIPLHMLSHAPDCILIDDDRLIRDIWSVDAKAAGINIQTFSSFTQFLKRQDEFRRSTPIFIDSTLGNGEWGEKFAEDIYRLGFESIYITTARSKDDFLALDFVKGVLSKRPVWKNPETKEFWRDLTVKNEAAI